MIKKRNRTDERRPEKSLDFSGRFLRIFFARIFACGERGFVTRAFARVRNFYCRRPRIARARARTEFLIAPLCIRRNSHSEGNRILSGGVCRIGGCPHTTRSDRFRNKGTKFAKGRRWGRRAGAKWVRATANAYRRICGQKTMRVRKYAGQSI